MRISDWSSDWFSSDLLSDATWMPLVHLQETGGGITQKDLAERVGIDGSSLVRVLDILSRPGLVVRRVDESDGRARQIGRPSGRESVCQYVLFSVVAVSLKKTYYVSKLHRKPYI